MAATTGYKDPRTEVLVGGGTVASAMRPAARGIKGVIIAPAAVDGRPSNFNPHDRNNITIVVEPDSAGGGQKIALSTMTKDAVQQALEVANAQISGNDIESVRERTALAFEELARMANTGVVARSPVQSAAAPVTRDEEPNIEEKLSAVIPGVTQPPLEQVDRTYSPMAAFGLKADNRSRNNSTSNFKSDKSAPAVAPNKLLYFEKEGIGTVPAFFHDVIVDVNFDEAAGADTGFIILIYDLRYPQATARWFPPSNDPYRRPWALQINNDRRLYLVQTTGFQYVYDDKEFCILSVEKAVIAED